MDMTEKLLERQTFFEGKVLTITRDKVALPDGSTSYREVAHHCGGVGVLPLTPEGDVLLVRQYRYSFDRETLEIPAGKMDLEGEAPLDTATRELKEETGCTAANVEFLGSFLPSPGCFTEVLYTYLATGLTPGDVCPDEGEFLELVRMPFDTLLQKVLAGEIQDGKTAFATLLTARKLGK